MTLELHEPTGATPLTPDELLGLKARHITNRGELNELEGENIVAGLTWLERRPKSFDLLTDAAVREVHKRLFGEVWDWAGVYRLTEKNIGVPVWHISTEMRTCLDDARYWRDHRHVNGGDKTGHVAARLARPLMQAGGSLITVSFYGADRVVENYNLMGPVKAALEASVRYAAADLAGEGIRAFSLSTGPVKTRAASGIDRFDALMDKIRARTPAGKLVSIEEIGTLAAFLATEAASPMSGSVVYADNGFHTTA